MSPTDPEHAFVTAELGQRLREVYLGWAMVREDKPLDGAGEKLPEPDLAVVRGAPLDYVRQHPCGADTVLVVEVARGPKELDPASSEIYARAGVAELWLLDLVTRTIEVRTEPHPDGQFGLVRVLSGDDAISPPGCDAIWKVEQLYPPPAQPIEA